MHERQKLQADLNSRLVRQVPYSAWDSTVAIVVVSDGSVHLLGSGVLFQIADAQFVVTARHVISAASEHDRTIGISDSGGSFVAPPGEWFTSDPVQYDSIVDPFDLALCRLSEGVSQRLAGKKFLRRTDIDFADQSATAVFSVFGFPGLWSTPSRCNDETLQLRSLEYTTYAYDGDVKSLIGCNSRYHLLLGASPDENTTEAGSAAVIQDRTGEPALFPRYLQGISGCSVWTIGDLKTAVDQWGYRWPKVVGIETGIYRESQVIRATRWVAVTTLIHEAFPDLRPALSVWT